MRDEDKPIVIYTTFATREDAERAGGALVDARLAACVNILPSMTSIYVWKGERCRESEVVMLVKTRRGIEARALEELRRRHPYENPALLVLPVVGGSTDFFHWIAERTGAPETGVV